MPAGSLPCLKLISSSPHWQAFVFLSIAPSHAAEAVADAAAAKQTAAKSPREANLKTVSLFDGKTLDGWILVPDESWVVKDGAMASTGNGRGMIYTKDDFSKFRLLFTIRHLKSEKDHHAGVLIFCARPEAGAEAARRARRHPVPSPLGRIVGLPQRQEQLRQGAVHAPREARVRSARMVAR